MYKPLYEAEHRCSHQFASVDTHVLSKWLYRVSQYVQVSKFQAIVVRTHTLGFQYHGLRVKISCLVYDLIEYLLCFILYIKT